MCTVPVAAMRRCRTATTWIIASPATFTTRTATTATTTVHWRLHKDDRRRWGDAPLSPRRRCRLSAASARLGARPSNLYDWYVGGDRIEQLWPITAGGAVC